jgi:predicted ATPase with chaperone activity
MITFGEVGLSGEIRPVPNGEERLKEAAHHGFRQAIVPKANAPKKGKVGDMQVIGVERLSEAIDACRCRRRRSAPCALCFCRGSGLGIRDSQKQEHRALGALLQSL